MSNSAERSSEFESKHPYEERGKKQKQFLENNPLGKNDLSFSSFSPPINSGSFRLQRNISVWEISVETVMAKR